MEQRLLEGSQYQSSSKAKAFRAGLSTGLPIFLGYIPIAIAYGVLAVQSGLDLVQLTAMSVLVYAGASQFMGAKMIGANTSILEVVIATFILNFRHFVMSLSFMNKTRRLPLSWKVPLSLGLTDESFAVSSLHGEEAKKPHGKIFFLTITLFAYSAWISGSLIGGLLGEIVPDQLSQSMNIALYAMFIALLVPNVKKEWRVGLIAMISMLLNALFTSIQIPEGWAIVFATLIGGFLGIFLLKEEWEK
jgi:4-azaleucine resistance transporter AzlC